MLVPEVFVTQLQSLDHRDIESREYPLNKIDTLVY